MKNTLWLVALFSVASMASDATSQDMPDQEVLGPGAYIYQTRLDRATCEEDSNTGYVTSYFAAIDGVPGDRQMRMSLVNTEFWPRWMLTVRPDGTLVGEATMHNRQGPNVARSHFELRRNGSQLVGRGYREYWRTIDGERRRCRNDFDALLRRLDLREPM